MKTIALACLGAVLLWGTNALLSPWVISSKKIADERLALGWLEPSLYDNHPMAHPIELIEPESLGLSAGQALVGYKEGELSLIILPAKAQGYVDEMAFEFALAPSGKLLATRFVRFNETPTIGDRILPKHSAWLNELSAHDAQAYDHLAGATKTSKAFMNALTDAQRYLKKHSNLWLKDEQ